MSDNIKGCSVCDDNTGPLHLHSQCHMTAPLRAELHRDLLYLFCYVPDCDRLISVMKVADIVSPPVRP